MKEKVRTLFEFIKDKKYSKAEELANSIDNLSHGTNPDVIKARVLIARGMKIMLKLIKNLLLIF